MSKYNSTHQLNAAAAGNVHIALAVSWYGLCLFLFSFLFVFAVGTDTQFVLLQVATEHLTFILKIRVLDLTLQHQHNRPKQAGAAPTLPLLFLCVSFTSTWKLETIQPKTNPSLYNTINVPSKLSSSNFTCTIVFLLWLNALWLPIFSLPC